MLQALIKGTTSILSIDLYLEVQRSRLYSGLLFEYGVQTECSPPFPYEVYPLPDPNTRCYDAAIDLATRFGLTYHEGIVMVDCVGAGWVPMAHGWCHDMHGNVIDPTMPKIQHSNSVHYHGVPIKKEYAHEWNRVHGYYGCLDGTPETSQVGVYVDHPDLWLDLSARVRN